MLEVVFEGVTKNSAVDHFVPHFDLDSDTPRMQLGATSKAEYNTLYEEQLRNVIEGYDVFQGEETPIHFTSTRLSQAKTRPQNKNMSASQPSVLRHVEGLFPSTSSAGVFTNWKAKQTQLVGGTNFQHPHCDNGIVNSYANLDVFPFVGIHGFGVDEFTLWLLPNPLVRLYGFRHTFGAKNLLLMRGDFVHSGTPSPYPRGHFEFFPSEAAGWTRKKSFWNMKGNKIHPTFLWQTPTYPFGYPNASEPDVQGDVVITYPPNMTQNLMKPFPPKICAKEGIAYVPENKRLKAIRREACAKVQAQSW